MEISLAEIAQESGVSSALVKYHFGNKNGLLMAMLRDVIGGSVDRLRQLTEAKLPPEEKLRLHILGLTNSYFHFPYISRLLHHLIAYPENAAEIANSIVRPITTLQQRILDEGVASSVFRPIEPLTFYFLVIGSCDHLFYGRAALEHGFGVSMIDTSLKRSFAQELYGIVLRGIEGTPGSAA